MHELSASLLAVLVALLVGLAVGKAWERYKLRDGRWIDRRRARESPHFILGLNFLVANQIDLGDRGAEQGVASLDAGRARAPPDPRQPVPREGPGRPGDQEHQALLQRPRLNRIEHAYVLLCLGLDYRRGGFVDRALEAFNEVLRLDPENEAALVNLEKLQEEQHQWQEAYDHAAAAREARRRPPEHPQRAGDPRVSRERARPGGDEAARLRGGDAAVRGGDRSRPDARARLPEPRRRPRRRKAIRRGQRPSGSRLIEVAPDRAYLAFDRLERAYTAMGAPRALRRPLPAPDRRQPAGLARAPGARAAPGVSGPAGPRRSICCSRRSSTTRTRWRSTRRSGTRSRRSAARPRWSTRYIELTRDVVFYLDPHVCVRCRYRSTELLWQCPHCHDWNTFVEERITPASDTEAEIPAGLTP